MAARSKGKAQHCGITQYKRAGTAHQALMPPQLLIECRDRGSWPLSQPQLSKFIQKEKVGAS